VNWKLIYIVSSMLMLILAFMLKSRLPHVPTAKMSYGRIFHSMAILLSEEKRLIYRSLIGGFAFAAMSILFSTIAVLLTSEPFKLPDVMVGVATLIGVFGALSTTKIGKIADRGHTAVLTWIGITILAASWIFLYFGGKSLISYILGYGIISLGLAIVHSSNQNIIFRLRPNAKSRINSIYMTVYFTGGACGSALGVYAWHHGGWTMTCVVGLCLVAGSAIFALLDRLLLSKAQTA
ncbi:MAG: MFS transporter, partial [Acinetobacter sp.]